MSVFCVCVFHTHLCAEPNVKCTYFCSSAQKVRKPLFYSIRRAYHNGRRWNGAVPERFRHGNSKSSPLLCCAFFELTAQWSQKVQAGAIYWWLGCLIILSHPSEGLLPFPSAPLWCEDVGFMGCMRSKSSILLGLLAP